MECLRYARAKGDVDWSRALGSSGKPLFMAPKKGIENHSTANNISAPNRNITSPLRLFKLLFNGLKGITNILSARITNLHAHFNRQRLANHRQLDPQP